MTANKRIVLNILATYGRSLYALVVGLFCARWTLMALGEVNFGLLGVVGGLISICATFNALMSSATTRFFAVAMGEAARLNREDGVENCRRWFNVAVLAHFVLATALVAVGYPLGVWAIEKVLTIPSERVSACLWVFRLSCLTTFVSMVNVPFNGMFIAKQEIAEQSFYSSFQTTFGFCIAGYMITHPGDWLVGYAALLSLNTMLPEVVICFRACVKYRECRLDFEKMRDSARLGQMVRFALCQSFTGIGFIFCNQGMNILVNKLFGPVLNASMGVATKVQTHASALTAALGNAFQPAIATAWGAGDLREMKRLALGATKFGMFCALVFVVPLIVGIDWVLLLWLKTPPPQVSLLCTCLLLSFVIDKLGYGQGMAVNASGRIAAYQFFLGISQMASIGFAYLGYVSGYGIASVGLGLVLSSVLTVIVRIVFAGIVLGFSVWEFLLNQASRILLVAVAGLSAAGMSRRYADQDVVVLVAMALAGFAVVAGFWLLVLSNEERGFVRKRIAKQWKGSENVVRG